MNYKEEIAKVLFDSNAPKEAVLWAMSNLPDTNKKGKNKADIYNHDETKISNSLNISDKKFDKIATVISKTMANNINDERLTYAVAKIVEHCDNDRDYLKFTVSQFVNLSAFNVMQKQQSIDTLTSVLEKLKKNQ